MLTGLRVRNFKSIGEPGVDLELRPLTLLVGPNGSGKSNVLEALALLAQSIPKALRPLVTDGDNLVAFQTLEEIVYRQDPDRWQSFGISTTAGSYDFAVRWHTGEFKQTVGTQREPLISAGHECTARGKMGEDRTDRR